MGQLYWCHSGACPNNPMDVQHTDTATALRARIAQAARELGFDDIGIADIDLTEDERHLERWLERGWHGRMHYMARHGRRRSRPAELLPGTLRVISARLNYWPGDARPAA